MSDTKHPATDLVETGGRGPAWHNAADDMLRRIPVLEAEIARLKEHAVVLANTAAHVEREACAALCDDIATLAERTHHITDRAAGADACAEAIRARKDTHE